MRAIDAPDPVRLEVIRSVTTFYLAFVDRLANLAAAEFTRERERVLRRRDLGRLANVRGMIAGGAAGHLDEHGYDSTWTNLGILASGPDIHSAVRAFAAMLDARLLSVETEEGALWAWLGGSPRGLGRAYARLDVDTLPAGCLLGAGRPGAGPSGFRTTHLEAQMAHELARTLDRPFTFYADVALEPLGGRDEAAAQRFARSELGDLLDDTRRAEDQRRTLLSYLAHGQSTTAAAAALHLSPRTVSYRLRRIEEILGSPISERSAELQTALRLHLLRAESS